MTKKEFQTIEKQLRQNLGELNKTQKKHLGLPDNSSFLQTIPIDEFEISEVGISEKERITGVRKQNINTQQQRDEIEKEKMKRIDHVTKEEAKKWNKTEEEVLKKSLIISDYYSSPLTLPPLEPEYPVNIIFEYNPPYSETIIVDNKTLYNLCLQDKDKTITARWNKTVLEYYRTFTVDTYKVFQQPFKNWFELGQTIVMDSSEYKTIPFLYNEYWDDELEYFKNKCTVAQIAYINLHILTNKYIESTSSKDNGKKISIRKAVILVYRKNKNKLPVWKTGSLNKYYHNGGNLMVDK
jgi:hypothetical protein